LKANGQYITTVSNGGYLNYETEPGTVTFSTKLSPFFGTSTFPSVPVVWLFALLTPYSEAITIPVEANEVYFVRFEDGRMGVVDKAIAEQELPDLKMFAVE